MTNGFYGGYNNPYQQQLQQLQQRIQAMAASAPQQPQIQLNQPQQPPPQINTQEDKILTVANEDVARNINIPLDGSTTYFKYDDSILARRWNISEGRVCSLIYKVQQEEPQTPVKEVMLDNEDRLKRMEGTLQEILKKVTYPINKRAEKVVKADKETETDVK